MFDEVLFLTSQHFDLYVGQIYSIVKWSQIRLASKIII